MANREPYPVTAPPGARPGLAGCHPPGTEDRVPCLQLLVVIQLQAAPPGPRVRPLGDDHDPSRSAPAKVSIFRLSYSVFGTYRPSAPPRNATLSSPALMPQSRSALRKLVELGKNQCCKTCRRARTGSFRLPNSTEVPSHDPEKSLYTERDAASCQLLGRSGFESLSIVLLRFSVRQFQARGDWSREKQRCRAVCAMVV
eukprot:760781-Hanusia_phi.AAC.4